MLVEDLPGKNATLAQLSFVQSAYAAAEGVIRLADEKFGYVLLFHGILVAILSAQGEGLLRVLAGPQHSRAVRSLVLAGCLLFLGAAGSSLAYALRSRALSADPPTDVDASGFLSHLAGLETAGLTEELARALHRTAGIAQRKLALLQKCFSWAAVAFAGWAVILLLTLVL